MRRHIVLVGMMALVLCGCRHGPMDPKPQEYDRLKDASEKVTESPTATGPATVTPRQAYEAFRDAIAREDYRAIWPLLSKRSQDDYDRKAAEFEMQLRNSTETTERAKALLEAMGLDAETVRKSATRVITGAKLMPVAMRLEARRNPEGLKPTARSRFAREEVFDDRAKVYVVIDGETQDVPLDLVREGTLWRVELGE